MENYNNTLPKVSILVPMYNAEAYVVETLDSCINQTYKNIEVIVVDDGSKDRSYQVALDYSEKHAQVKVFTQVNGGGCKARNTAFSLSTGDYIMYLDADDIISPDKVQAQIELLMEEPYTTVATCKWDRFYDSLRDALFPVLTVYEDYNNGIDLIEDLLNGSMFGVTCYMVSRRLIEETGKWDENILVNQDGEFFVRVLLKAKKVSFANRGALYYRSADKNSISRTRGSEKKGLSLLYSYKQEIRAITEANAMCPRIKSGLTRMVQSVAYLYDHCPKVIANAKRVAKDLGISSMSSNIGGSLFRKGCRLIGFWNMLQLKNLLKL